MIASHQTEVKSFLKNNKQPQYGLYSVGLVADVKMAWNAIAPVWPASSIVATNILQGYESYHFDDAIDIASGYSLDSTLLPELATVNRETIKWCQALLDDKHATIMSAHRDKGFFGAFIELLPYDKRVHLNDQKNFNLMRIIVADTFTAINLCLDLLKIKNEHRRLFLTLMLTTLPGWSGYVKYLDSWRLQSLKKNLMNDYLAMRMVIAVLHQLDASRLVNVYYEQSSSKIQHDWVNNIKENESIYTDQLCNMLVATQHAGQQANSKVDAQFVFCIDPRSEVLRRHIEKTGNYETFGYAGFFGIPLAISNTLLGIDINACPPFLYAKHHIDVNIEGGWYAKCISRLQDLSRRCYQSLKYSFNTPFLLVDLMGWLSGVELFQNTFIRKSKNCHTVKSFQFPDTISFNDKCLYAEQLLVSTGLTSNFAKVIVLCAHESQSANNAYASSLDCGACGGVGGAYHAMIIAEICNDEDVRTYLATEKNINIPADTSFHAAIHNTGCDEVTILGDKHDVELNKLHIDLKQAGEGARQERASNQNIRLINDIKKHKAEFLNNWSQVRPEWGLVNNAAIIIGPRQMTKSLNLQSRAFLHSYDCSLDPAGEILKSILAGPVMVAYWINMTYLFSSVANQYYGAGSKITQNITGKQNIMQGNASDIMLGLPMQSLYERYDTLSHQAIRLNVVINAPQEMVKKQILANENLKRLVLNEWLFIYVLDPNNGKIAKLSRFYNWLEQ